MPEGESDTQFFTKSGFGQIRGLEFALNLPHDSSIPTKNWGLEEHQALAAWANTSVSAIQHLAEKFQLGALEQIDGRGPQGHVRILAQRSANIVVGMLPNLSREEMDQNTRKVLDRWAS